jgi:hypothetical protein
MPELSFQMPKLLFQMPKLPLHGFEQISGHSIFTI